MITITLRIEGLYVYHRRINDPTMSLERAHKLVETYVRTEDINAFGEVLVNVKFGTMEGIEVVIPASLEGHVFSSLAGRKE